MNKQSEKLKVKGEKYKICATDFEGITLVALVITIIVLIILAGVSINAVMNQGLITNAKDASGKFDKEKDVEELLITSLEGIVAVENLEEVKAGGYTGTENRKYSEGGRTAVIPAGFTVSKIEGENTISEGLVIYSNKSNNSSITESAEVYMSKIGTDESYTEEILRQTYNQYVWIPVDNPSDMYGILESPVKFIDGTKYGKFYGGSSGGSNIDASYNWPTDTEKYNYLYHREPCFLTSSNYGDNNTSTNNNVITADSIKTEFDEMITSVEKYKGFYIGRYELAGTNTAPMIIKGSNPIYNLNWYNFYKACKNNLEKTNTDASGKIYTSIIWDSQWDQAVKAIVNIGKVNDFLTNPTVYGNFKNSTGFQYTKVDGTTGTKTTTGELGILKTGCLSSAYNIYDMCGNVLDWTMGGFQNDGRSTRGGVYTDAYEEALDRWYEFTSVVRGDTGCRAQLYIK